MKGQGMFRFFARKKEVHKRAQSLYAVILAQSRLPAFYASRGVPDTFDGRFDSLLLHSFLVFNRLQPEGSEGDVLNQALFDVMFRDIFQSLRQVGVGDLSVPKHVKRMMKASKGRCLSYQAALADRAALEDSLRRNLFGTVKEARPKDIAFFADYIVANVDHLAAQAGVIQGNVTFKDIKDDLTRMVA